jgi:hypothetical protein
MASPVSAEIERRARMLALLYYIPDRWRKGSSPLPYENQEGHEEGSHIYTDELISRCASRGNKKVEMSDWPAFPPDGIMEGCGGPVLICSGAGEE